MSNSGGGAKDGGAIDTNSTNFYRSMYHKEELAKQKFDDLQKLKENTKSLPPHVGHFMKKITHLLEKRSKKYGGTGHSILKGKLAKWDSMGYGYLTFESFKGLLYDLGFHKISMKEAKIVFDFYDAENIGKIRYRQLVHDACSGIRHYLSHPSTRSNNSFNDEENYETEFFKKAKTGKTPTMIERFKAKLFDTLMKKIAMKGGTIRSRIYEIFILWDRNLVDYLSIDDFRGAMRHLQLNLSLQEAKAVANYYAFERDPTKIAWKLLLADMTSNEGHYLSYPKTPTASERLANSVSERTDSYRSENYMFTGRPTLKPTNQLVEKWKIKVGESVKSRIIKSGDNCPAILEKYLRTWDIFLARKLPYDKFFGCIKQVGYIMTPDERIQVCKYYDTDNSGMVDYPVVLGDFQKLENSMLYHIEPSKSGRARAIAATVTSRVAIPKVLDKIHTKIRDAGEIAAKKFKVGDNKGKELLMGSCLRYDQKYQGKIKISDFKTMTSDLGISLTENEKRRLVSWYAVGDELNYRSMINAIYQLPVMSVSSSLLPDIDSRASAIAKEKSDIKRKFNKIVMKEQSLTKMKTKGA